MTIDNMNKSKLVPKKDYKTNRLTSGKLQLSDSKLVNMKPNFIILHCSPKKSHQILI